MDRLREFMKRFNERPSAKSASVDPIALIRSYEKHCRPGPIECVAHIADAVEAAITEILRAVHRLQSVLAVVKQQSVGWDLARGRAAVLKRAAQAGAVQGGLDLAALAQAAKSSVGTIGGVELAKDVGHRSAQGVDCASARPPAAWACVRDLAPTGTPTSGWYIGLVGILFRWVGVINMLAGFNQSSLHPLLAQHMRPTAVANLEGAMWDEVSLHALEWLRHGRLGLDCLALAATGAASF
jgi:hypothetical protein